MGNEPRYLFLFRSTASARCFPTRRAALPRLEPAQGLTMVMSSRSALFLSRGWLSKSVCACVCVSMCVYLLKYCTWCVCGRGGVCGGYVGVWGGGGVGGGYLLSCT